MVVGVRAFPDHVQAVVAVLAGVDDDIAGLKTVVRRGVGHAVGGPVALDTSDGIGDLGWVHADSSVTATPDHTAMAAGHMAPWGILGE